MTTFSLITINCFGGLVPTTPMRLLALARELDRHAADVVCLQEVQMHAYRRLLTRACTGYPASAYEPFTYAPKGGLLTLAQQPITSTAFSLYPERGRWYTPALADWMLHKGVLCTSMTIGGLPVIVLNTHLSANYRGDWERDNQYVRTERAQLRQLAEIVRAQPAEALLIVAGDFNIPRGGSLYAEFLDASGLTDPLAGDIRPTVRPPPGLPARYALPIDFALLRAPDLPGLRVRGDICFQERLPLAGRRMGYLSDHYGVELEVQFDGCG
jgi:endonuclease/exonuclease/phosphatase family metal-dependent hydrolase